MSMFFKRIKDWATSISAFRSGDVIPVDGPSGTAKMSKDDLLKQTGLSGAFIYDTSIYSDWNDLPIGKSILISAHLAHEPSGVSSPCIGVTIGSYGANNFAFQFCYDITVKNQLYFRKMQSNSWSDWENVVDKNFLDGKLSFITANLEGNVANADVTPSTWTQGYWGTSGTAKSEGGKYTILSTSPGDIICICGYTHSATSCIVSLENNAFENGTKLQQISTTGNNCTYAKATSAYTGVCFWNVDSNTKIYKLNAGLFSETIKLLMDFPDVQNNATETKNKTKFLVDNLEKAGNENVTPSTFTNGYWNKTTGNWASNIAARATIIPTDVGDVIAIYGYCHNNTAPVVALTENSFVGGTVLATVASSGENILLVKATSAYTGVCFWHSTIEDSEIKIYKLKTGIFKQVKENADAIDLLNSELQSLQAKTFYVGYGTADGVTHFDKVWDAMEATVSETGWVNIEIYSGTYDLYTEMGGADYLSTITDSSWRNWVPVLHKVRMRGHGDVKITYMPPSEVVALYPNANNVISILNIGGDCEIENLTLEGQYCRYIIHDQVASQVAEERISTKVYKNLRCKMVKTSAYGQVVGGGFDLHQVIKYIDCYFEGCPTQSTWSYHQGYRATFVIDNCVFVDNSNKDYCVRFGNMPGTVSTYRCPVRFSNCYFNKAIRLNREWGDVQSVNNFDITITNSNSVSVTLADEISDIIYAPKIYNTIQ